ncbi:hypothetical protein G7Y79_00003g010310 [Physcia stellaris]|nr:hypothetical protein G7Y79_00003g010310 [Physcia stellaris]
MPTLFRPLILRQAARSLTAPHWPKPYATMTTPGAAETDTGAAAIANSSGITPQTLSATLKEKLDASHVDINDISGGCGQAFEAMIVSPQFVKKNTLARHRLVNSALKAEIAAIHAWTPKCMTPEEWEKKQAETGPGGS